MKRAPSKPAASLLRHRRMITFAVLMCSSSLLIQRSDCAAFHKTVVSSRTTSMIGDLTSYAPQTNQRPPMTLITIRSTGFDPAEVSQSSERFLLAVDNKTGLGALTLRIRREGGELVREVRLSAQQPKWREKVSLSSGTYLFTEADHADWHCRLTVKP
jgi:hypothetical protein